MTPETFAADIPIELARAAHQWTSHVPDRRAEQERADYAGTLARDWAELARLCRSDAERAELADQFATYRGNYADRFRSMLLAKSRCASTMITGGSNFPVRRARKASDAADKRTTELLEYRTRALTAIRRALRPELQPVMLGDSDAAERLREKVEKREATRDAMKAANAAIRKHSRAGPEAQLAALRELFPNDSDELLAALLRPDFAGRVGFADYKLTNLGAEIRRLRGRLVAVERNQAAEPTEVQGAAARLEDCPAENRVRLFFPDKPAAEVRSELKSRGFRWAPSIGCWQAYRNPSSIEVARKIAVAP